MDIRHIQILLGHTRIESTSHYARLAIKSIGDLVSPFDRIGVESVPADAHAAVPAGREIGLEAAPSAKPKPKNFYRYRDGGRQARHLAVAPQKTGRQPPA
jgi:hypothetical protein